MQYLEEELQAKVKVRKHSWKAEAGPEKAADWKTCIWWRAAECHWKSWWIFTGEKIIFKAYNKENPKLQWQVKRSTNKTATLPIHWQHISKNWKSKISASCLLTRLFKDMKRKSKEENVLQNHMLKITRAVDGFKSQQPIRNFAKQGLLTPSVSDKRRQKQFQECDHNKYNGEECLQNYSSDNSLS